MNNRDWFKRDLCMNSGEGSTYQSRISGPLVMLRVILMFHLLNEGHRSHSRNPWKSTIRRNDQPVAQQHAKSREDDPPPSPVHTKTHLANLPKLCPASLTMHRFLALALLFSPSTPTTLATATFPTASHLPSPRL